MNPNAAAFALILKQRQQLDSKPPPPPTPLGPPRGQIQKHSVTSNSADRRAQHAPSSSMSRPPPPSLPPAQFVNNTMTAAFFPTVQYPNAMQYPQPPMFQCQPNPYVSQPMYPQGAMYAPQPAYSQVQPSPFHLQMAQYAQPQPPQSQSHQQLGVPTHKNMAYQKGQQKHKPQNNRPHFKNNTKQSAASTHVSSSCLEFCESCDKEFKNHGAFVAHLQQHEPCPHAGCTFSASKKAVAVHHSLVHGLYRGSGFKTIDVEGQPFRVLLGTDPAEVAQWRESRKKRFPTEVNAAAKRGAEELLEQSGGIGHAASSSSSSSRQATANKNKNENRKRKGADSVNNNNNSTENGDAAGGETNSSKKPKNKNSGRLDIPKPLDGGARGTLLRKLLSDEITSEENMVLQCLRFFVQQDFFLETHPPTDGTPAGISSTTVTTSHESGGTEGSDESSGQVIEVESAD